MKKMVLVLLSGALCLTSCGNNVEVKETETKEHVIVETIETEKIEVEELDIETVYSSDSDEVETDESGDFIYDYKDYESVRGYVPTIAQEWTFDRYNFTNMSNEEFDIYEKEYLLDCGTIVCKDSDGDTMGFRVFVDKYEHPGKAETYFVMDGIRNWKGTVDVIVLWSYDWISKNSYDRIHELCEYIKTYLVVLFKLMK